MNLIKSLSAGARNLPAVSATNTALTARLTGINRFGIAGFLSLETAPYENTKLLRDGYMENHIVFTVADWKAQQFAKAPPIVYEVKDEKSFNAYRRLKSYQKADSYSLRAKSIEEIDDPDDRLVRTLRQPNPSQTWAELAYALSVYHDFGNALLYGVGPDKGANAGQFQELYLLPTALYSGEGPTVNGYTYFVDSSGVNPKVDGRLVLHLRRFNALTEGEGGGLWGMSKLSPARRVLVKSTQAQEAEAELFLNRGARTIIFPKHYDGLDPATIGPMAKAAGDEIRRKLKQAGSGGIATNSIELGVIQLGLNSDDLKLMESNALTEKQICALWHVDTIAVFSAVTEASRANGETAVRKSLIEGVMPDQNLLAQKLNQWLLPAYNRNAKYHRYLEFNTDVYPQLQTDKKDLSVWMGSIAMTENERREAMGYGRIELPEMDIPTIPTTRQPITDFAGGSGEQDEDKEPKNDGTY